MTASPNNKLIDGLCATPVRAFTQFFRAIAMWNIRQFDELPSTNTYAKELFQRGEAKHGDVIQARHQTAGRGRIEGRNWQDEPDSSLLMSIVLERQPLARVELLQYQIALAIAECLRLLTPDANAVRIKWPNDIQLKQKKVAGILSEGVWQSQHLKCIIVGIGINVRQRSFPSFTNAATSLLEQSIDISVDELRDRILTSIDRCLVRLQSLPGHVAQMSVLSDLRTELTWMTELSSLTVAVSDGLVYRAGRYEGIADNGGIILRMADGERKTLHAGTLDGPTSNV